jgi:hypothetical protein
MNVDYGVYGDMKKTLQTTAGHWLFEQDIAAIALKVGLTPEARLRWVVEDFAAHPNYSALPPEITPINITREASVFLLAQLGPGTYNMGEPPHLPPALFERMAREVDAGLDEFIAGKGWTARAPIDRAAKPQNEQRVWVSRTVRRSVDGNAHNSWRAPTPLKDSFPLMFVFAVMDLLQSEGWRAARCARPDCTRRFVRSDPRQNYCGTRCSQTTRTRRLRVSPKEEEGK